MERSVALAIGCALVVTILWPWFLLVIGLVLLGGVLLISYHKHGRVEPFFFLKPGAETTVVLNWFLEQPSACLVRLLPPETSAPQSLEEVTPREYRVDPLPGAGIPRYRVELPALSPGKTYRYEVYVEETHERLFGGSRYHFSIPRQKEAPPRTRFAVVGDVQAHDPLLLIQSFFFRKIRKARPDLFLNMGDSVHRYDDHAAWHVFFVALRALLRDTPFYTTPGNHDYGRDHGTTLGETYLLQPGTGWDYAFSFKNLFFVSLNSMEWRDPAAEVRRVEWLDATLAGRPPTADFTIFFTHVPAYGPDYDGKGGMAAWEAHLRDTWYPVLERHGADLYFAGHKHTYYRLGNRVISGAMHGIRDYPETCGPTEVARNKHHYCLVEVTGRRLEFRAIGWTGKVLDQFVITKPEPS